MPEITEGTIVYGRDIGKADKKSPYIWAKCISCGKGRWVQCVRGAPTSEHCQSCNPRSTGCHPTAETKAKIAKAISLRKGPLGACWKGGRLKTQGYIRIWVAPDRPFAPMRDSAGYVLEHRLVMAQHLNRCLLKSEHVHHKDGIKDHNEDSNLELISQANHNVLTTLCANCELRKEVRLLRWQVKELTSALQERLKV